ncbi:MAG: leucine--tRNA ligase [Bacilli bacterium]|nr:leucine--tRNA ligase [Bacilli bacterium]
MSYEHKKIEQKWAKIYEDKKPFYCDVYDFSKPKYYILDMFPYPSGQGLHVGHPEGYTATDVVARMKRMQGFNVLHPMGWDSFGLPAEQFAIKNNKHPDEFTQKNIANFKKQIKSLGFSYDWSKEIATSDPAYYKWTQWIFTELYKSGLAYVSNIPVNYCPELGTVLANEEVVDGKSERGGYPVIKMPMRQWVLSITKYADKLIEGLDSLDWPKSTLTMQENWIGKSLGASIIFKVENSDKTFEVFTTRADTLFGCTYCCLAPEHPLVKELMSKDQEKAVLAYIDSVKSKSDMDRTELNKDKTGVFIGAYAINPINGKRIPIYAADYVLYGYGSGAVMAVPAHDQRDYEFAKKHDLEMIQVLEGDISEHAMEDDAKHINSDFINGLYIAEAKEAIIAKLEQMKAGSKKVNYKLRDWIFSRQRYWGEPIPVAFMDDGSTIPLELKELPLTLPELEKYAPSGDGSSPLKNATKWLEYERNGVHGERETNTMPQWAGSCWYYIRYLDPKNNEAFADPILIKHWLPVDLYIGGSEHAVLHLLYARFWHKFLFDKGYVFTNEPFKKLFHQGMILGENGEKMSKSRGNVINPDDIVENYGADSLRLFEMFAGPLEESFPWSTTGLAGARRFIERVYRLFDEEEFTSKQSDENSHELDFVYNATVKKVTNDFESLQINTAISQMMIFVNALYKANSFYKPYLEGFVKMFSCVCPFVGEEIYEKLTGKSLIDYEPWPKYNEACLVLDTIKMAVSVNGKPRAVIEVKKDTPDEEVQKLAMELDGVKRHIEGKEIKRVIVVKNKIVNIVAI